MGIRAFPVGFGCARHTPKHPHRRLRGRNRGRRSGWRRSKGNEKEHTSDVSRARLINSCPLLRNGSCSAQDLGRSDGAATYAPECCRPFAVAGGAALLSAFGRRRTTTTRSYHPKRTDAQRAGKMAPVHGRQTPGPTSGRPHLEGPFASTERALPFGAATDGSDGARGMSQAPALIPTSKRTVRCTGGKKAYRRHGFEIRPICLAIVQLIESSPARSPLHVLAKASKISFTIHALSGRYE